MKRLLFTFAFLGIIALANGQDPDVLKSDAIMAESIDDFASAAQLYESAMAPMKRPTALIRPVFTGLGLIITESRSTKRR
ncbi:hypothetical protein [Geofilum rubicundum]|uniref:Uncharacterized protein n=1 Tax=Geofilum rubicundum JCM 15548 TaxID=1236989 RepID=A0A0E9LZT3_9BACT|nr:hypothetical protein [Geofilum rubicundum]GAO30823.1 hypothetical protein JCM15548_13137 [Geofilum rubicundum JCM 15548]